MALVVGTWQVSIEDTQLVKEMVETGEYGIGGYPITESSMIEFFRNWVFGLDPNTYKQEWARNPACHYHLSLTDEEGNTLWQQSHQAKEKMMSKYKIILELHLDVDNPDELDDAVYDAVRDVMLTDIMSACEVEEIK